jgi:hypothetical protein
MSSAEARDEIFLQHDMLRGLLAEVVTVADLVAASGRDFEILRQRAKALYEALAAHMTFEEQVLPAALRDVIGWGAVIQQTLEEDHARQREIIATAISEIGPDGLSGDALIESVRAFVDTLIVDMKSEERGLSQADFDALAADSRGG